MSAHTPGPWVVVRSRAGYPVRIEAPNGSAGPGGITSVTRHNAISLPSSAEGAANARLIAAAPELLDLLQEVMRHYVEVPGDALAPRVFAVIAKATGAQP